MVYHENDPRLIITIVTYILYFLAARFLASFYMPQLTVALRNLWFIPLLFLGMLVHFYFAGRIHFIYPLATGLPQPQISGGIRSTEVALFAGLQFIYLVYCLKVSRNRMKKIMIFGLMTAMGLLLILLQSFGAVSGLALIGAGYLLLIGRLRGLAVVLALAIALGTFGLLFIEQSQLDPVFGAIQEKLSELDSGDGKRGMSNVVLVSLALEHPAFGIGWGMFVEDGHNYNYLGKPIYPHNNLLGMAAENGLVTAGCYALFILSVLWIGLRGLLRKRSFSDPDAARRVKIFLFMALACFAFIQWRGLFQDTWRFKEVYLWAGVIAGAVRLKGDIRKPLKREGDVSESELQ
jgi:O-antigen ligase